MADSADDGLPSVRAIIRQRRLVADKIVVRRRRWFGERTPDALRWVGVGEFFLLAQMVFKTTVRGRKADAKIRSVRLQKSGPSRFQLG